MPVATCAKSTAPTSCTRRWCCTTSRRCSPRSAEHRRPRGRLLLRQSGEAYLGDEVLQQLRDHLLAGLVAQVALVVEALMRGGDRHLGLHHRLHVEEHERLTQLVLGA